MAVESVSIFEKVHNIELDGVESALENLSIKIGA
jgi:hypothetical protein